MCHIHPIYAFFYWDCTSVQNCRAIGPLFIEILHFKDSGDTSVVSECSLGVNLVSDNICYVVLDTSPLYKIWKQSDHYLWRYCILGDASFINECSLGVNLVIDNFLCSFRYFTSVLNLKEIGLLLMEILHFEDLGDTTSVVWPGMQLF